MLLWRCSGVCSRERPPTPKAKGIWRDDERNRALVTDEPVVVHCYTTPADISIPETWPSSGASAERWAATPRQGEVGLVIGDEYFAIREFTEE